MNWELGIGNCLSLKAFSNSFLPSDIVIVKPFSLEITLNLTIFNSSQFLVNSILFVIVVKFA